jgi:hypothetical protein
MAQLLIISLFAINIKAASAQITLEITVNTNQEKYGLSENLYINGSIQWKPYNIPITTLIGIEIRDPANLPFIFRTRPSGNITSENWPINYTQLFTCNSNGQPKDSFKRGENLYMFLEIKNLDNVAHTVTMCITVFDSSNTPIGSWYPRTTTLQPNTSTSVLFWADKIPTTAATGTATIYANAYTDLPKNGGYPYCPEKTATFTITTSTTSSSQNQKEYTQTSSPGIYDLTLKLPPSDVRIGNYTIYVSAYKDGYAATANKNFQVLLIGDINGDKTIDIYDAIIMGTAYGSKNGDPSWNPNADLNGSGEVDIYDAIILSTHFGETAL